MTICSYCKEEALGSVRNEFDVKVSVCYDHLEKIIDNMAYTTDEFTFFEWAKNNFKDSTVKSMMDSYYGSGIYEEVTTGTKEYVWLFAFGILKRPASLKGDGAIEVIENCTISNRKMYLYNNSFPITSKSNSERDVIYGTLAKIPLNTLLYHYDVIEGYDSKAPASRNMYNRIKLDVNTPDGQTIEANMYEANPSFFDGWYHENTHIKTGNYDDMHTVPTMRYKKYKSGGKKNGR